MAAPAGTSTRYDRPYRPAFVSLANRLGQAFGIMGFDGADLDEESLLSAARKSARLEDFGDPAFLDRLRILLGSIEKEARLHPLGRYMARQNLIRILTGRLRMVEDFRRHPEIFGEDVEDPLFIVGLQRTGTTLLHRLLATDPAFHFLYSWEAVSPAPLGPRREGEDPRIRAAEMAQLALRYLAPDFFAVHPVDARGPEEDVLLFDYDFWSTVPEALQRVPTFSAWLEKQDHHGAYKSYKKILQYLHWQRPGGRWLLKTPHHMEHLDVLLEVFPRAQVIQTHRDPARVLASFCSMVAHAHGIFSDRVDPREVGAHWSRKAELMVQRAMEVRDRVGPDRFIDVAYADLVADPVGQVRRVYERLGRRLTLDREERMRAFMGENPQHKYGMHNYRLEDFGLDRWKIESAFAGYRKRWSIPGEGPRTRARPAAAVRRPAAPMQDRVCLVTGATSGHGQALALALARLGAEVVLLGRSRERLLEMQHWIAWQADGKGPLVLHCDLSSHAQIERAADEFLSWNRPLHVLVNNAGIVSRTRRESEDGIELTLAVNYLAQYHLTLRLLDRIIRSAPARIINVSSDTHRVYTLNLDDLEHRGRYSFMGAYGRSKHAIVYFTRELAARLEGTGVTVNAVDPGPVASNIAAGNPGVIPKVATKLINLFFPAADRAAQTALWLASAPEMETETGGYYKYFTRREPRLLSRDPDAGRRLWEISACMTGVDFTGALEDAG